MTYLATTLVLSLLLLFAACFPPVAADAPFSPNVRVNDDGAVAWHVQPSLAVDARDNLYIVWSDNRTGRYNIYASRSTDGGATWAASVRVNDYTYQDPWGAGTPDLIVDFKGTLHTIWNDPRDGWWDIYSARSTDGGATWSANVKVNDDSGTLHSSPSLAVDARGYLYAAWTTLRGGYWDVYAARSTDGGATWSESARVNDILECAPQYQCSPSLVAEANGTLHAVWNDFRNAHWDVYSARSSDGGATWSANVKVNDGPGISQVLAWDFVPSLAMDRNGNLYAAWEDWRNAVDVYSARSSDGGETWSANVKVNDQPGASQAWFVPSIAVDDVGTVYVGWQDFRNGAPDFYLAKSTDMGAMWSPNLRVNDAYGRVAVQGRALAANGVGNVHAAWPDGRNGQGWPIPNELDIYFSRWSAGPPGSASPTVAITEPADGQVVASPLLDVTGTSTNATIVQFRVDDGSWVDANGLDPWSGILDLRPLAEGNHTLEARAFNGSVASPHAIVTFVLIRQPDYVPSQPQPTAPLRTGLSLRVPLSLAVLNQGNATASGGATIAFFNASTPAVPFATFPVPPLAPSAVSGRFSAEWMSPPTPGAYDIVADVDYGNAVWETNETNNLVVWAVNVVAGPITSLVVGAPSVTASVVYVTSATPLSFTVLDQGGTGIRNTTYRVDGGPWTNYTATGPFALAEEEVHVVEWSSEDLAGNVEPVANATIVVDDTPPSVEVVVGEPKYAVADLFVTSSTPFSLAASDGGLSPVGLATLEYRSAGGPWIPYGAPFALSGVDGPSAFEYRATDLLGNMVADAVAVVLDNTPPVTAPSHGDGTYPASTAFAFTPADAGSGVASTTYSVDGGEWAAYGAPLALPEGNHVIRYRSADRLYNLEAERTLSVTIEGSPPSLPRTNWKPLVAAVFALILALVGAWSAWRVPANAGSRPRVRAFVFTTLPFVVLEAATGIVSLLTGWLLIPPILGVGTVVDLGILIVGVFVLVSRSTSRSRRSVPN